MALGGCLLMQVGMLVLVSAAQRLLPLEIPLEIKHQQEQALLATLLRALTLIHGLVSIPARVHLIAQHWFTPALAVCVLPLPLVWVLVDLARGCAWTPQAD
jgi:hypothetical protein